MKINWGTALLITIITFVTFLVSFALFSLTQTVNLVSEDYFLKGIEHSEELEKERNTDALIEKIRFEQKENQLTILFPKKFENAEIKGTVKFYYVINFKFDVDMKINTIDNKQIVNVETYKKGRYIIKVDWETNGKKYFQEFDTSI